MESGPEDGMDQVEQGCEAAAHAGQDDDASRAETAADAPDGTRQGSTWCKTQRHGQVALSSHGASHDEAADEPGDSSSHPEHDDVFSNGTSPRSSLGSMSEAEQTKIEQTLSQRNITQRSRSPRISHGHHHLCYAGPTPRPPFRSPSSVQALQMSSPPASVGPATPRSTSHRLPRLGSPSVSAQYSPKKTPPRFRRATPPLVLLHATLLPLRWSWGPVLDGLARCSSHLPELSHGLQSLREAWRQLGDRTADTVSDRGVLLPHPQADYEVLEERLLEALELPQKRRARILQCGHYLGPASQALLHDQDSDPDLTTPDAKTHWCYTCRSEIRYDSSSDAHMFRVKVYASNGLMRAGAWEACWREMERIDVEIEPIIDALLQDELAQLAVKLQLQDATESGMDQGSFVHQTEHQSLLASSPWLSERQHHASSFDDMMPESPTTATFERRATRRQVHRDDEHQKAEPRVVHGDASLGKLLVEASQVFVQERSKFVIALLLLLIAALAARGTSSPWLHSKARPVIGPSEPVQAAPTGHTRAIDMTTSLEQAIAMAPSLDANELRLAEGPTPETMTRIFSVTETVSQTRIGTQTETQVVTQTETQTQTQTQTQTEIKTVTETETQTKTQSEIQPSIETHTHTVMQTVTQTVSLEAAQISVSGQSVPTNRAASIQPVETNAIPYPFMV
ncbi:hypothetical protein CDD82_2945 [Ophiocordyceps australis]|uniref:Pathway-specific nitrogen regulator n=1 Tax=Ophiocordyceps australis TaxID=1399860 RepID=A0A2C5ZFE6_9HYPO|nr:hypothetical protein CDD82_2945 [Ophiocordyceps australis]